MYGGIEVNLQAYLFFFFYFYSFEFLEGGCYFPNLRTRWMLQPLYIDKKPINCYIGDKVGSTAILSVVVHTNVPFFAHIKPWPHTHNQSVYLQFIIDHKTFL